MNSVTLKELGPVIETVISKATQALIISVATLEHAKAGQISF